MQTKEIGPVNGIRAVAFAVVFASSVGFGVAPATHLALDVILILSGFLVASSLRGEFAANGSVDVMSALARRAVRIIPALTAVSAVGILLDLLGVADGLVTTRGSVAHLVTISGLAGRANPDTIGSGSELLWPVFVVLHGSLLLVIVGAWILRRTAAGGVLAAERRAATMAVALVVVLLWRTGVVVALGTDHPRLAMATDLHLDAIFAGSILGFSWHPHDPTLRNISDRTRGLALLLSVTTFAWLMMAPAPSFQTTIGPSLYLVAALPVVFFALHPSSPLASMLSHPAFQLIGRLSFALFLTHLIGLRLVEQVLPDAPRLIVGNLGFLLTLGLAHLLQHSVVLPTLRIATGLRPGRQRSKPVDTSPLNSGILRAFPTR